jgi:hypothetical protein
MELNYFYKAEMPNCQDWTLDVSKLNIFKSLHWEASGAYLRLNLRVGQIWIEVGNSTLNLPYSLFRSSNSHKSVESLPALIPSIF